MPTLRYSWTQLTRDCATLAVQVGELARTENFHPLLVVGIARGGLIPATLIARHLGLRSMLALNVASYQGRRRQLVMNSQPPAMLPQGKRGHWSLLLVDDVVDSGRTLQFAEAWAVEQRAYYRSAALHYKPGAAAIPYLYANRTSAWIVYPWEVGSARRDVL